MGLFAIHISFLVKRSLMSFAYFLFFLHCFPHFLFIMLSFLIALSFTEVFRSLKNILDGCLGGSVS